MRTTERQYERSGNGNGVTLPQSGVGVYEFAQVQRGVEGTTHVLGILPERFGERAGKIVADLTVPDTDVSEATLGRVEAQCIEFYGVDRHLALVG